MALVSVTCNRKVLMNTARSDGGLSFLSCRMKVTGWFLRGSSRAKALGVKGLRAPG